MDPIDEYLLEKLKEKLNKKEKKVDKEYEVVKNEIEEKKNEQNELHNKFIYWRRLALNTLQSYYAQVDKELAFILNTIAYTIRNIGVHLKNTGANKLRFAGSVNDPQEFNELCTNKMPITRLFIKELIKLASVGMIICRRSPNSILKLVGREKSDFIVVVNAPSLAKYQALYGCAWAIYRWDSEKECPFPEGREAVAVGYAVLGSTTTIVTALKTTNQVMEFLLDPGSGNFVQFDRLIIRNSSPTVVFNESKKTEFKPRLQEWIKERKKVEGYNTWFTGQFIVDINTVIHNGGVYIAPSEINCKRGRLKVVFDCIPLAYILEKMNGIARDDMGREFLQQRPSGARQYSTFIGGSPQDVYDLLAAS